MKISLFIGKVARVRKYSRLQAWRDRDERAAYRQRQGHRRFGGDEFAARGRLDENILVDMPNVDGKPVEAPVHFDRDGFAYVLDRTDGNLLRAHKFVSVNWAEKVDLKTGRPVKLGIFYKTVANARTAIKRKLLVGRTSDLIRIAVEMHAT